MSILDEQMNRFRLASRNTYNHYFHPVSYGGKGFSIEAFERFEDVEQALFNGLVVLPCQLKPTQYGVDTCHGVGVRICHSGNAPVMINREISGGYWDHSVKEITPDTEMTFVRFFDFDQSRPIDHRYAQVVIAISPSAHGIVGKHALIETQYIEFRQEG